MRIPDDTPIGSAFLRTCDIPADELRLEACVMLIFGGAGDLSRRKLLPAIYRLFREGKLPEGFAVLAFDRAGLTEEEYRSAIKESIRSFSRDAFYERLLLDCMRGDLTLFVREDVVEEMWGVVDPIISRWEKVPPISFPNYPAGSLGSGRPACFLNGRDGDG